ncbi:hypothetical protein GCM10008957_54400 [Deinococcus ruber]|uniref:histidine kinase n=2 Tax=Deinococcus ruber TaxID=1848197 RepID=A0A918FHN4_9DEIO|nr:hypothetical protein GCM10008957_54400 [Deinococcus ruber]
MMRNGGDAVACGVGANYLAACDQATEPAPPGTLTMAQGLRGVLSGMLEHFRFEYPCHSPAERRWYSARVTPVMQEDRTPTHAVVVHEEITAHCLAEEHQQRFTQEIDSAVQTRTQDLQVENRELNLFASAISHDLRAPVRHLTGFVGVLKRRRSAALDERDLAIFEQIERASVRLEQTVDQLLTFSRTMHHRISFQEVALTAVVEQAWEAQAPSLAGRTVQFRCAALPIVRGAPTLLQQVFENLLSNAVKYSRWQEAAQIEVGCVSTPEGWDISVRDNGAGFDPALIGKLFLAFSRLHRAEEFEGTGIGLLTVKRIIERHGGQVWATGAIGQGAQFHVLLPNLTAEETASASTTSEG